ncbi:MAG: CatA-like O-acetyltransferase [Christensenellales bacterium]|nr:CatA-like O-acetyltransferase [Christensenellales bacterium]
MKEIAYRDWYRYEHAEFFRRPALPYVSMTFTLEAGRLRRWARARGVSFYLSLVWASQHVMDMREDFRWRIRGDRVALIDHPIPSFSDMTPGSELFKIVNVPINGDDMEAYARRARAVADAQTAYFPPPEEEARDDYTYFSSSPLAVFRSLTQPMDLTRDDCIPAIAWSRYYEENGRLLLPYAIQFNHRVVDGWHVARFINELQAYLDALE